MTPEQQRIAIAESCGLPLCPYHKVYHLHQLSECTRWECPDAIPDYLNDLNAMHEAEKQLAIEVNSDGGSRMPYYYYVLFEVCYKQNWPYQRATAAQRAEAFLKTIGKWKD